MILHSPKHPNDIYYSSNTNVFNQKLPSSFKKFKISKLLRKTKPGKICQSTKLDSHLTVMKYMSWAFSLQITNTTHKTKITDPY